MLLLKEHHLPRLPSDIVGHLYKEFDARDIATTIRHVVDAWLQDVGIAKSASEKLVVFVSYGEASLCDVEGCRSKSIRRQRFAVYDTLRIYGSYIRKFRPCQQWRPKGNNGAFGEDLLESHRVMRRNRGIIGMLI